MPEDSRIPEWKEQFEKAGPSKVERMVKEGNLRIAPQRDYAERWVAEEKEKIKREDEEREEKRRREEEERAAERRREERDEENKQRREEAERLERIEKERLQLEQEKLQLEKQKFRLSKWGVWGSIIVSIAALLIAALSYFFPRPDSEIEERVKRLESRVDGLGARSAESPSSAP